MSSRSLCLASIVVFVAAAPAYAEPISASEILRRVDANYVTEGRVATSTMIIAGRRGKRELVAKTWIQGKNAFTEYLAPARERGTKMLKLDDRLWTYTPASDRTIAIAGHLLRTSMSGSDYSYEDFMADPVLANSYKSELEGETRFRDFDVYVLNLTAKDGVDAAYYARKIWVDKKSFLPVQQKLYAKSGKPLKTMVIEQIFRVGSRFCPKRMVVKDLLLDGDGTTVVMDELDLDVSIPPSRFSKALLRK